jgi:hypothetical protein
MAILKSVPGGAAPVPVPDFYVRSEPIARMIVDAWVDKKFRDALLERDAAGKATPAAQNVARASLAERGVYLEAAVVITETEYHNNYTVQQPYEIAFVLPDIQRVHPRPNQNLLETAELLMATTPNGI